jgi:serine/threonine protein kinase
LQLSPLATPQQGTVDGVCVPAFGQLQLVRDCFLDIGLWQPVSRADGLLCSTSVLPATARTKFFRTAVFRCAKGIIKLHPNNLTPTFLDVSKRLRGMLAPHDLIIPISSLFFFDQSCLRSLLPMAYPNREGFISRVCCHNGGVMAAVEPSCLCDLQELLSNPALLTEVSPSHLYHPQNGTVALRMSLRLTVMRDILRVLAHLYKYRICHYDIKPANILMSHRGNDDVKAMLVDFGSARPFDSSLTKAAAGCLEGRTYTVRPPEDQTPHPTSANANEDLYSVGVVCHQVIQGDPRCCFLEDTATQAVEKIIAAYGDAMKPQKENDFCIKHNIFRPPHRPLDSFRDLLQPELQKEMKQVLCISEEKKHQLEMFHKTMQEPLLFFDHARNVEHLRTRVCNLATYERIIFELDNAVVLLRCIVF